MLRSYLTLDLHYVLRRMALTDWLPIASKIVATYIDVSTPPLVRNEDSNCILINNANLTDEAKIRFHKYLDKLYTCAITTRSQIQNLIGTTYKQHIAYPQSLHMTHNLY